MGSSPSQTWYSIWTSMYQSWLPTISLKISLWVHLDLGAIQIFTSVDYIRKLPHMALHKKVFPYMTLASISDRDVSMPLTTNLNLGYPDPLSITASYTTQFMPCWVLLALHRKGTTRSVRPTHPIGLSGPTTRSTIARGVPIQGTWPHEI